MKNLMFILLCSFLAMTIQAEVTSLAIGDQAPEFSLTALDGKTYKLSDFRGKVVILEWINPGCPFVVGHYASGNMPGLQEKYTKQGMVWLTVNSTRADHPEARTPDECREMYADWKSKATAHLIDPNGSVGKLYSAKTTPHMIVIAPDGKIAYNGAIDDDRSTNGGRNAKMNYVSLAVDEITSGKPVTVTTTKPYGCSVKY